MWVVVFAGRGACCGAFGGVWLRHSAPHENHHGLFVVTTSLIVSCLELSDIELRRVHGMVFRCVFGRAATKKDGCGGG